VAKTVRRLLALHRVGSLLKKELKKLESVGT
jgi:hypothetical protein